VEEYCLEGWQGAEGAIEEAKVRFKRDQGEVYRVSMSSYLRTNGQGSAS
jgi:hypothetical protein